MIKVQHLQFRYKKHLAPVLEDVNLEVADGETVVIVGRNGSGKSTLGRLIAGITKVQHGTVEIAAAEKNYSSHDIGIMFQNPDNQIIFSNIHDELSFALSDLPAAEVDRRIDAALEKVEMLEYKTRNLYELSLGQKQRVMLAELLARGTRYLVLDEPTTMIDSFGKAKIHQLIRDLKKEGYTIILLSNAADEILLGDRMLVLENGRIVEEAARADFLRRSAIFREHQLLEPTILQLAQQLEKSGIKLDLQEFTVSEMAKELAKKVPHRRREKK